MRSDTSPIFRSPRVFAKLLFVSFQQADNFCNSIGILQQFAQPSNFPEFEKSLTKPGQSTQEDYPQLFASLVARTAKDIDVLIDSLPSEEASPELQAANLRRLELENQDAARRLEDVVQQGEALLEQIQQALHDIAESQLNMQHLEDVPN